MSDEVLEGPQPGRGAEQLIDGYTRLLDSEPELVDLPVAIPYLHTPGSIDDDVSYMGPDVDLLHRDALGRDLPG
jgi:hypothetical protein